VHKESSYVHALSLSVIAHTVAKACHQDLLEDCADESPLTVEIEKDVEYQYSSDNAIHGLEVAKTFLGLRYANQGSSLKNDLINHNLQAVTKAAFHNTFSYLYKLLCCAETVISLNSYANKVKIINCCSSVQ